MLLSNLLTISHCIRPRPLLPPPPLPGVWGRNLSCLPTSSLAVGGPRPTLGRSRSARLCRGAPSPSPSAIFPPSIWARLLGLSARTWRPPLADSHCGWGRQPPGGLGGSLPGSGRGRASGRFPSGVGNNRMAALHFPLSPSGLPLVLQGDLLLLLLLQLPHCPLQTLPALLVSF